MDVIAHTKPFSDESLDALRGPQLRGVTFPRRTTRKKLDKRALLDGSQFRRTPRTRRALQRLLTLLPGLLQPLTDRGSADSQSARDIRLCHTLAVEGQGLKPSFLKGGRVVCLSHGERLARMTTYVK